MGVFYYPLTGGSPTHRGDPAGKRPNGEKTGGKKTDHPSVSPFLTGGTIDLIEYEDIRKDLHHQAV